MHVTHETETSIYTPDLGPTATTEMQHSQKQSIPTSQIWYVLKTLRRYVEIIVLRSAQRHRPT